jgi:thiol-disulfide isomerase/thioredoxin
MRKLICLGFVFFSVSFLYAQGGVDTTALYQRFPTVPPFKLLQPDSVSFFSKADLKKNRAVLVILFSPTCEHCQYETEEIIRKIDDFKKVQIVMATPMPFDQMKEFYAKYKLARFDNIKVGRDYLYFLPSFFMVHNLPYLAMYNKKGNLLKTFEGNMKIDDLLQVFK